MESEAMTLKQMILCVEHHNEINKSCWAEWDNSLDIVEVFAPDGVDLEGSAVTERFVLCVLDRAIESNGKSLPRDCHLYERMIWGSLITGTSGGYWISVLEKKYMLSKRSCNPPDESKNT